jgi:magnesium transporter
MTSDSMAVDQAPSDNSEQPWREMIRLADAEKPEELEDFVSQLSSADQAMALSRLDQDETERVLETLEAADAAEVISHLTEAQAAQTIGSCGFFLVLGMATLMLSRLVQP